jgi:hypothetical protein
MKQGKIIAGYDCIREIKEGSTPLSLVLAKNLNAFTKIVEAFTAKKEAIFQKKVVMKDGQPKLKEEVEKAIKEGKINPNKGVPHAFFEFPSTQDETEFQKEIAALEAEEIQINMHVVSMGSTIYSNDMGNVPLGSFLNSTASALSPTTLSILIDLGILID